MPCAIADQAHHLCARLIVEPPAGKNLRHLLAKLPVAFQRAFDVLTNRNRQPASQCSAIRMVAAG